MGTFWVPDHALEPVFRFLGVEDLVLGARNVCRQWRDVVDQLPFWTRYQHCFPWHHNSSLDILQNMPSLRSLKTAVLTPGFMEVLTQSCPNLREIELEMKCDRDRICERYPIDFKCKLKLEGFKSYVIGGSLLKAIAQCPNLTRLSLVQRSASRYECEQVKYLLTKIGHQLVSLVLSIDDREVRSTLPIVIQYCTSIQHLKIRTNFHWVGKPQEPPAEYSSSHLQSLKLGGFTGCIISADNILAHFVAPNLVYLRISSSKIVCKDTLTYIFDSCKQLTELKLEWCCSLSDELFESIHLCENLKRLDIRRSERLTEQVLEFIRSCPKLEFLSFDSSCTLGSKGLDAIAGMRNLQEIHLRMSGYPVNARETLTRNLASSCSSNKPTVISLTMYEYWSY